MNLCIRDKCSSVYTRVYRTLGFTLIHIRALVDKKLFFERQMEKRRTKYNYDNKRKLLN